MEKIYVSAGCGADFGITGKQAGIGCLCFGLKKWNDSIEAPSMKYFTEQAIKNLKAGKKKRLFLFSYDQGYREFYEEFGKLLK